MSRISVDLKSIDAIKPGTHSITVKASADGYKDSEFSEAVSYTKGISFSIDGTTYWAYDDSTWAEWCADTSLNTAGFYVDEYVYSADGGEVKKDGTSLFGTDKIADGNAYEISGGVVYSVTYEIEDSDIYVTSDSVTEIKQGESGTFKVWTSNRDYTLLGAYPKSGNCTVSDEYPVPGMSESAATSVTISNVTGNVVIHLVGYD